ncbi:VOC family protein [Solitalea lacus]|uniref:VOC family protein n=1 Tax=Solitalea lacus TaxID=2911172 RepID=UPI001EDB1AB3|nr:VOC family protein [Solitalea lacus]UKJ06111.1 VOC family protein [Solitalea lacus]
MKIENNHPKKITPFLWFDDQAEEAVNFYVSVFKNSSVGTVNHWGEGGLGKPGSVLTVSFTLEDQEFVALNGGPQFKFTEAVSFVINCDSQDEIDYYWNKLTANGGEESRCGWLKDKYGLSWQVVPTILPQLLHSIDPAKSQKAIQAMLQMRKLDIAKLQEA